jgi:CRISPR-associated protein Csm5
MGGLIRRHRLRLSVVTPVHVGTGQELSPLDYVIRGERLYVLDQRAFLAALSPADREKLKLAVLEGDLVKIRDQIYQLAREPERYSRAQARVGASVKEQYHDKRDKLGPKLAVYPHLRGGSEWRPLIPGSSLKGAIRTAVLEALVQDKHDLRQRRWSKNDKKAGRKLEAAILGHPPNRFDQDPFADLVVGDVSLPAECTRVLEVRNLDTRTGASSSFFLAYEVVTLEPERTVYLEVGIRERHGVKEGRRPLPSLKEMLEMCRQYYLKRVVREQRMYEQTDQDHAVRWCKLIAEDAGGLASGRGCYLRLGRFSQREYHTLEGVTGSEGAGVTRNLVLHEIQLGDRINRMWTPMGWVYLELVE